MWLGFAELAHLFDGPAVLLEFLTGLSEFALGSQALVFVHLLARSLD
jgi:hypothetical protein